MSSRTPSRQPGSVSEKRLATFGPLIETIVHRWRRGCDDDFAADLRQVATLACHRALKSFDPKRGISLESYIYCCSWRAARDAVLAYRRAHEKVLPLDEAAFEAIAACADPETKLSGFGEWSFDGFLDAIGDERLHAACRQLDPQDQQIVVCHYAALETDAEIAVHLHLRPATVKKRRQRAIKEIRDWMLSGRVPKPGPVRTPKSDPRI